MLLSCICYYNKIIHKISEMTFVVHKLIKVSSWWWPFTELKHVLDELYFYLKDRHTNVCCVWLFWQYFTCVYMHTLTWVYTCKNLLDAHISLYFTVYYSITLFNYVMYCNPYNPFECSITYLYTFLECQTVGSARLSGAGCKEFCCTRLCHAVNVITMVSNM